jgi:hypothetical protein
MAAPELMWAIPTSPPCGVCCSDVEASRKMNMVPRACSGQRWCCLCVAVQFASTADFNLSVALQLVSWMCCKQVASSVKSPSGVTVCWKTLEHWNDWQAHAQLWQSFCTRGHTKRSATIFAVAFEPGGDRSRTDWNTWSRSGPGTYGRGLLVEVSCYIDTGEW